MNQLFNYWFHPTGDTNYTFNNFWFDESKDQEIYNLFNQALVDVEQKDITYILQLPDDEQFYYLILFDQITRNIARITNCEATKNDDKALLIASNLFTKKYDFTLHFLQRIFIMLPFRHTNKEKYLNKVITRLNEYNLTDEYYEKFYMATLKNYSNIDDNIYEICNTQKIKHAPLYNSRIHDLECEKYDTLEIPNIIINELKNNALYKSVLEFVKCNNLSCIGVSLSGGVDSMVLLFMLKQMVLQGYISSVVAIHLNYNLRKETEEEAQNLINICAYLNIPMVYKNIRHFMNIKIDVPRDFFEDETKNIRFNLYKYAIKKYNLDGIALGHHKDDMIENVFMNIMKGKSLMDLFVMSDKCVNYDVTILRPMLKHIKDDVIDIANKYSITYFKNTTPTWSFRGIIRNDIFPAIEKFDKSVINNLYSIGVQSAEWKNTIQNKLINPVMANIQNERYGFILKFNGGFDGYTNAYWSELIVNVCHKNKIKMVTQKCIRSFTKWIDRGGKVLFSIGTHIVFCSGTNIYFLIMNVYNKLCIDCKNGDFSSWNITSRHVPYPTIIFMKTMLTYDNVLRGEYNYCVNKTNDDIYVPTLHNKTYTLEHVKLMTHIIPKINDGRNTYSHVMVTLRLK